jgi:N-acetylglucosamine kinase-like BadF-type ATPase
VLRDLLPLARIRVDSDGLIALLAATRGAPGMIVIAGTGSFVLGIDRRGVQARGGGWGPLLGDEGGGATLGRGAIQAVLRAEDGRASATRLRARVLAHFRARDAAALVSRIYLNPPPAREYARLWPAVCEEAASGDLAARALLRQGGNDLAETVEATARRLDFGRASFPLVLAGGVLSQATLLRRTLLARLRRTLPRAEPSPAAEAAELGAVYLVRGFRTAGPTRPGRGRPRSRGGGPP